MSPQEGTWAISSYSLASAIMQPLSGWIGRRFGEVRSFCVSAILFVVMSMFCGLATSMPMLVVGRLLQGAGSGPMVALSLSLLLNNYPNEKKGLALALWAMTVVVAPIFGPILGGYITDNYSWPWIFYINVPVGMLAVLITWTLLRNRESVTVKAPIDMIGLVLLIVGVGCLQFMLDNGNDKDWFSSPMITTLGVIALVCITFFVAWELTDQHPVVDLSLFRSRNFTIGVIAMALGMIAFFGINVVYPLWLQTVVGYTASWAGYATAPVGILAFLMAPIIGRNIQRLELRWVVTFSFTRVRGDVVLVLDVSGRHLVLAVRAAALPDGSGDSVLLHSAEPGHPVGTEAARDRLGVGPLEFLPHDRGEHLDRGDGDDVAAPRRLPSRDARRARHRRESGDAAVHRWSRRDRRARQRRRGRSIEDIVNREALTLAVNDVFLLYAALFVVMIPIVWLARPPFGNVAATASH